MNTAELIQEVTSLPVEERTLVVDQLLYDFPFFSVSITLSWVAVAEQRCFDYFAGRIESVSGFEVFADIRDRFKS